MLDESLEGSRRDIKALEGRVWVRVGCESLEWCTDGASIDRGRRDAWWTLAKLVCRSGDAT